MLVFLMMGLILYLGVRLVLEKTITGPTDQLLEDVKAFVDEDQMVPLRMQQSQELDQLYQAIHEMTVSIQESRKQQLRSVGGTPADALQARDCGRTRSHQP